MARPKLKKPKAEVAVERPAPAPRARVPSTVTMTARKPKPRARITIARKKASGKLASLGHAAKLMQGRRKMPADLRGCNVVEAHVDMWIDEAGHPALGRPIPRSENVYAGGTITYYVEPSMLAVDETIDMTWDDAMEYECLRPILKHAVKLLEESPFYGRFYKRPLNLNVYRLTIRPEPGTDNAKIEIGIRSNTTINYEISDEEWDRMPSLWQEIIRVDPAELEEEE